MKESKEKKHTTQSPLEGGDRRSGGVKERPIIFSTYMVKAILEGRKMQTRRLNNLYSVNSLKEYAPDYRFVGWETDDHHLNPSKLWAIFERPDGAQLVIPCPYGKPGDLLYVRESFQWEAKYTLRAPNEPNEYYRVYKADKREQVGRIMKWIPSIHMPKSAARIWLEITDIRVERLNDISEKDAKSEGVESKFISDDEGTVWRNYLEKDWPYGNHFMYPVGSFRSLWQSINGQNSWKQNPWVWAITFKVVSTEGRP